MKYLIKEYQGPNFMRDLLDQLLDLQKVISSTEESIKKYKFKNTTIGRDFAYVEKFINDAIRYAKLGYKALEDATVEDDNDGS